MKAVLIILLAALALAGYLYWTANENPVASSAFQSYQEGLKTLKIADRKSHFNEAFEIYLALDNPNGESGKVFANRSVLAWQLEKPSYALWYAEAALKHDRTDPVANQIAEMAAKQLNVQRSPPRSAFTLPELFKLISLLTAIAFILSSLTIWYPKKWLQILTVFSLMALIVTLTNLAYRTYFSPIQAIAVQPAVLRRGPGNDYAKARDEILPAGSNIHLLETAENGQWAKISTDQEVGFVPSTKLQILPL